MRKFLDRWFARPPRSVRPVSRRTRPTLEMLEDRLAPAVFTVNSTADILNPTSGTVTLRSAIEQANATTGNNTINLSVAGTYFITIPGADQGNNATGAFDIIPNVASPAGSTLSIINTSGGTVIVDGNHLDRVFDINPGNTDNPATKDTVLMQGFTIQNGIAQTGDGAMGSGGGIRDQGNTSLTLTNMVITNNQATADGGGVSMENAPASTPWTLTVNNSVISYNHAGDAGGGLETDGKGKTFINAGTVITGNTTLNQGAGIWLDAIADGVASVTILSNDGGYTAPPTVTFSAPQNAGGTTATGIATLTSRGIIAGVTITDPGSGYTSPPTVTISVPFAGAAVPTASAALGFNNSSNLTITGALISNNVAVNGPTGAIGNAGAGAVTIANSTVENNFSGTTGGGFGDSNNLGTLTVTNSLFLNNTALTDGGAIQEGGPTTTIANTEIKGNTAGLSGGGIFASGPTLTILSSTIADNIASGNPATGANGNGGGIELETTGASTITDTTISGNSALNNNGTNMGTPQVGGGIDAADTLFTGSLALLADTINGNYATNGGGIFFGTTGTITVQNTIVAGNIAQTTGPDANNIGAAFTDDGGNLIGNSTGSTGFTAASQVGTAANPLDPLLGPLTNNLGPLVGAPGTSIVLETEALLPGSPALAKGVVNGAPATDARGFPRIVANTSDVGATQTQTAINFENDTQTLDVNGNVVTYTQSTTADALGLHMTYTFTVDGQVFTIPGVEVSNVIVAGIGTKPMITLTTSDTYTGTDGLTHETTEAFILGNGGGIVAELSVGSPKNFLQILGFTTVDVFAGPADFGQINGTVGVMNTFVGAGGYAYMNSGSAFYYIGGAKYVYGYAANPGDVTYEYDGSGPSTLAISGVAYSYMTGSDAGANFFNEGVGFKNNYAVAKHPGQDTAYFFDSPANDVFVGNTGTSYMYSTDSAGNFTEFDEVMGSFATIIAESFVGGTDFAYNHDPAHITTAGFHVLS
jgi:hypothetical protein